MFTRFSIILLLVSFAATTALAEAFAVNWADRYGAAADQATNTVAVGDDLSVIVAGEFDGSLTIGNVTVTNVDEPDLFLTKLDPDGDLLWWRYFEATDGVVKVLCSDVDAVGNIALAGHFTGTLVVDGAHHASAGGNDAFLMVLEPGGQVLWVRTFGGVDSQSFKSVVFDDQGALFASGLFRDQIEFGDGQVHVSAGDYDAMLARFQAGSGLCTASRHWGNDGNQFIEDMVIASDGDLVLGLRYDATFNYDLSHPFPNAGGYDVCIWRLDPSFALQSSVHFGDGANQYLGAVAADPDGSILITGLYNGTITIQGQSIEGGGDIYLLKFDAACSIEWMRDFDCYGSPNNPELVTDMYGNILLAGSFNQSIYFDDQHAHLSPLRDDVYLAKFSPAGDCRLSLDWGTNDENQWVRAMAIGHDGRFVLGGLFEGGLDFPQYPLVAEEEFDAWVASMWSPSLNFDHADIYTEWEEFMSMITMPIPYLGTPFDEAFLYGGGTVDATIGVHIENDGQPIVGYPAEDIWLADPTFGLTFCAAGNIADAATDAQGNTSFGEALVGGGSLNSQVSSLRVTIGGTAIAHPDIPLSVNSPDITGDLVVNLSDVANFAHDYYGSYNYRSDFNFDQAMNLSDIAVFAMAIGAQCPNLAKAADTAESVGTVAISFERDRLTPTLDLAVGESHEAFVLAELPVGEVPVAWDFRLETSSNLRIDSCEPVGRGLNLRDAPRYTIGAPADDVARAGGRTVLMRLVVTLVGAGPATVNLRSGDADADMMECALVGHDQPRILVVEDLAGDATARIGAKAAGETPDADAADFRCYPNPFNPSTTIAYALEAPGDVLITIHDTAGRLVRRLDLGGCPAGTGEIVWHGADDRGRPAASGIYFARLTVDGRAQSELIKMALLK